MPYSSGTFSRIYNWVNEQLSSPIEISKLDAQEEDFATALNNCILRDGTGLPTAAIPFNSQKITGLADAAAATDALNRQSGDARYALLSGATFTGAVNGTAGTFSGALTALNFVPTGSTVPANGVYLPAANTVGIASNTTLRASVNSTGNWTFVAASSGGHRINDTLGIARSPTGSAGTLEIGGANPQKITMYAADSVGDCYVRFVDSSGNSKADLGFTATSDETFSITSYMNFRLKFRTGDGVGGFINRAGIFGNGTTDSYISVVSPRSDDVGGCYVRFLEDDDSTTKGFVGFASTSNDHIQVINSKASGDVQLTPGSGGKVEVTAGGLTVSGGGFAVTGASSVTGTLTATAFSGDGSALTALSATQLTSGTVPDARFPATLPALSGVNLTALNASNLASGTVATGRISGSYTGITAIGAATINDSGGSPFNAGYLGMPQSTNTSLVLTDRGKHILLSGTTNTVTIPANASVAFEVGSTIVLINDGSGNTTLNITTDTLEWYQGGASTTGSGRTIATKSVVTLVKVASTRWVLSGSGIS